MASRYAFENGADFLCVGMYDFQVVEDSNIALDVLQADLKRKRPLVCGSLVLCQACEFGLRGWWSSDSEPPVLLALGARCRSTTSHTNIKS